MAENQQAPPSTGSFRKRGFRLDPFLVICWAASAATVAALVWIVAGILVQAWPAVQKAGLAFFTQSVWNPNRQQFGANLPTLQE